MTSKQITSTKKQNANAQGAKTIDTSLGKTLNSYVRELSSLKNEPEWMLNLRLKALEYFNKLPMPSWGPQLNIDFSKVVYFKQWLTQPAKKQEEIPEEMLEYFKQLKIPEAEQKFLAGVEVQYDSSVVYESYKKQFAKQGVMFMDTDSALKQYPQLFKKYFGKLVPFSDNKFAALNTAFWSGGSFVYVPRGVKVSMPIHAFFVMQTARIGQFERTLIIVEDNAELEYLEGCTAPLAFDFSLHAAVVEIFVGKNAKVKYATFQNWSKNVYNLVTKRAIVDKNGNMQWVDVNVGSKVTMKYPACVLKGDNSKGSIFSLSIASKDQNQDTGTKMIHIGKNTRSLVVTKAIGKQNGISEYRGLVDISKGATNSFSSVSCDALLLYKDAKAGTKPVNKVRNTSSRVYHEATVSQLDDSKLYMLQARGLSPFYARMAVVGGFVDSIVKQLPLEFAAEFNTLLEFVLKDE